MRNPHHPEDVQKYETLLVATADGAGVLSRKRAESQLATWLVEQAGRANEFAAARAQVVADGFDRTHGPRSDGQEMLPLDVDTYIVVGDSERINVDKAMSIHTLAYMEMLTDVNTRENVAYANKWRALRECRALQDRHNVTLLEADKMRRNQDGGER